MNFYLLTGDDLFVLAIAIGFSIGVMKAASDNPKGCLTTIFFIFVVAVIIIGSGESENTNSKTNTTNSNSSKEVKSVEISQEPITETGFYYVTATKLNVRKKPNGSADVIIVLNKDEKVEVLNINGSWAQISQEFRSNEGNPVMDEEFWVFSKYLSKEIK